MIGQAHQELEELAVEVWKKYSKRYRNLIPEYQELIKKKRELKITPLNQVKKSTFEELPEIEFLRIRNKKELRSKLKKYSTEEITSQVLATTMMVEGYAFRTIESHIYDYKYEIRHFQDKKKRPSLVAYDSDYSAVGSW